MDITNQILQKHWACGLVPVDPVRIANSMGIRVVCDATPNRSGHYIPPSNGEKAVIAVNPNESHVRQRFTIAHELAHHVLSHGERDRTKPIDYTLSSPDPMEAEANKFAAKLLMPTEYLKYAVLGEHIASIEKLSKLFDVSTTAMYYRLKEIGYVR